MPKYRVLETSFIGNRLVQPGDVVDYDGEVSGNLQKLTPKQAQAADAGTDGQDTGGDLA